MFAPDMFAPGVFRRARRSLGHISNPVVEEESLEEGTEKCNACCVRGLKFSWFPFYSVRKITDQ